MPQKLARRIVFRVVSLLCGDQSPAGAELHPYDCGRTTRNPSAFRKSCWTSSMRYSPRSRAAVCALRSGKALRPSTTAPSTRSNCCTTKAHLASSRRLNRCIRRRRPRAPAGRSNRPGSAASVRNTACPGSGAPDRGGERLAGKDRRGEPRRDGGDLRGVTAAEFADQRAAGDPVGAQPVQDRLGEAGQLSREPRIAVQRIAVAGQPVDQRLVLAGRQRDPRIGLAVGDLGRHRPLPGLPAEAALAADHRGRHRLGDDLCRYPGRCPWP